jgi:hypothetical protein
LCRLILFFSSSFLLPPIGCDSSAHPVGASVMLLGGFGFLSRLHGLSIDNLVEAEVVLADGSILIVNEKEHPGKLVLLSSAVCGGICRLGKSRSLVGFARWWPATLYCNALQSTRVSSTRCLRRKPDLVRLSRHLFMRYFRFLTLPREKPLPPRDGALSSKALP